MHYIILPSCKPKSFKVHMSMWMRISVLSTILKRRKKEKKNSNKGKRAMTKPSKLFTHLKVLNLHSMNYVRSIWPYRYHWTVFDCCCFEKKIFFKFFFLNNLKATKKICFNFENCISLSW